MKEGISHNMEYNSQKEKLINSEYGRNIQELVNFAKTIEDKDYRTAFVDQIARLITQMNPQYRNVDEFRAKMWNDVFHIANYDLDVNVPEEIEILKQSETEPPPPLTYPQSEIKARHYGKNVETLIDKALEMEDEKMKKEFTRIIGSYMKVAYKTWNKEHYVSDEVIKGDLAHLSDGQLVLDEETQLNKLTYSKRRPSGKSSSGRSGGRPYKRGSGPRSGRRDGRHHKRRK